jgi:ubiquinone/menaquinone biosynthesis C-methylase UbiE
MGSRIGYWKLKARAVDYLTEIRGAIPFAAEQIELMRRLVVSRKSSVHKVLDLGCGDGVLGQAILDDFPKAAGTFLDYSGPMLESARTRLGNSPGTRFILEDFGEARWSEAVSDDGPYDVIVSGFSIHHQPDQRKRALFGELYGLLAPNGIFLNLEHVSSPTSWVESNHNELFVDCIANFHADRGTGRTRAEVSHDFYHAPVVDEDFLTPVEVQCQWLREIGFQHVDCYFKVFELALFGGRKPIPADNNHHELGE